MKTIRSLSSQCGRLRLLTSLVLGLASVAPAADAPTDARKPNIVYILLDDAGYGDLGCYGQKKLATPHIDRLADEGMRFTQHYSGSTVCAPTRCVLMTGLHTGHSYIRGNRGAGKTAPEGEFPIPEGALTVAKLLQSAGYATGGFGKWGLGGPGSSGDVTRHGFNEFYGYYSQSYAHDFFPRWLWHNEKKIVLNREKYAHGLIMAEALRFIRENKDNPFFCYIPVTIPHAAMQAPKEYHDRFRKEFPQFEEKIGKYGGDNRETRVINPIAGFAAMMTKMDEDVGRLLDLLKELGLDEHTIVMLSSDNGPHKEGGHDPVFWDSNGPLKGTKRDLYEGGVRVPLLARWPGRINPGADADHISAHWDILPTFCDLAGIPAPENTDGISMLPTLTGSAGQQTHDFLYWEFYEQGGKRATRFGDWKAVQLNWRKGNDPPIQLFNLKEDLGETKDVSADHPELVDRARKIFRHAHTADPNWAVRQPRKPKRPNNSKSR